MAVADLEAQDVEVARQLELRQVRVVVRLGLVLLVVAVLGADERDADRQGVAAPQPDAQTSGQLEPGGVDIGRAPQRLNRNAFFVDGAGHDLGVAAEQAGLGEDGEGLAAEEGDVFAQGQRHAPLVVHHVPVRDPKVQQVADLLHQFRVVSGDIRQIDHVAQVQPEVGIHGIAAVVQPEAQGEVVRQEIGVLGAYVVRSDLAGPDVQQGHDCIAVAQDVAACVKTPVCAGDADGVGAFRDEDGFFRFGIPDTVQDALSHGVERQKGEYDAEDFFHKVCAVLWFTSDKDT